MPKTTPRIMPTTMAITRPVQRENVIKRYYKEIILGSYPFL